MVTSPTWGPLPSCKQALRCTTSCIFQNLCAPSIFSPCKGIQESLGLLSWILDSTPWFPDSRHSQWNLDYGLQTFRILDSLSCIPDTKAQDSGVHVKKFSRFWNRDSLTWSTSYFEITVKSYTNWRQHWMITWNLTGNHSNKSFAVKLTHHSVKYWM